MMIKLEYMYESLPFAYVHELQILYAIPIQHTKHSVSGMEHSPNYKVLYWTALHFILFSTSVPALFATHQATK